MQLNANLLERTTVYHGVTQGCFSPTLFNIYLEEVVKSLSETGEVIIVEGRYIKMNQSCRYYLFFALCKNDWYFKTPKLVVM